MKEDLVLDVNESPKKVSQWLLFAIQHVLAMLVACITVPMLTGLPIGATLIAAGIGTMIYILFTKKKSPVFLSSSFAYLSPMYSSLVLGTAYSTWDDSARQMVENGGGNYWAVILGMVVVGLIYVIIALIIKKVGTRWLDKLLPPVVIGPTIMVIGLGLAGSAVANVGSVAVSEGSSYMSVFIALIAVAVTAVSAHYGKKMLSLIPFVCGMGSAYILACIFTGIGYAADIGWMKVVNFSPLTEFEWGKFSAYFTTDFMLSRAISQTATFDGGTALSVLVIFAPVALVTVCEHIGDHKNLGNIIHRDLINEEPGLSRTLMGDGIATAVSGAICGAANTTYGENVAVIGVSKIASVSVVLLASALSIVLGFFAPLTALLSTIPACITGGVSLILYGFIASSGVKMLIHEKVDFGKTRNIMIASVILVSGIGGMMLKIGSATITSTAMSMILGIVFNLILREKEEKREEKSE